MTAPDSKAFEVLTRVLYDLEKAPEHPEVDACVAYVKATVSYLKQKLFTEANPSTFGDINAA